MLKRLARLRNHWQRPTSATATASAPGAPAQPLAPMRINQMMGEGAVFLALLITLATVSQPAEAQTTLPAYAAGPNPTMTEPNPTTDPQPPVYQIEFLGLDADGTAQPGANIGLKVTRVDGVDLIPAATVQSISIGGGLTFQAVQRIYYADGARKYDHDNNAATPAAGDNDGNPDVRLTALDYGPSLRSESVEFPSLLAAYELPPVNGGQISFHTVSKNACLVVEPVAPCGAAGSDTARGEPNTMDFTWEIVVPTDATPGLYVLTVKGYRETAGAKNAVTETRTLTIGSPPTAAAATLLPSSPRRAMPGDADAAPRDGYADDLTTMEPTTMMAGAGATELSLSILDANGNPPHASAISSIVLTTTGGLLSTEQIMKADAAMADHVVDHMVDQPAPCKTNAQATCEIDLSNLKRSGAALPQTIRVQLKAPPSPGMATVAATVISGDKVLRPDPVQIIFSEPPALSADAPPGNVLGRNVDPDETANRNAALTAKTYTLEVTSGTIKAMTTFKILGAADSVELTLAPTDTTDNLAQSVTARLMPADPDGNAVAHADAIAFGLSDLVDNAVAGATVPDDSTPSLDGEATINATDAPEPPTDAPSLNCLSALSEFAAWTCDAKATASELLGLVSARGMTAIHLWNGAAWIRYSVADATILPGSTDFPVARSDILYIGS